MHEASLTFADRTAAGQALGRELARHRFEGPLLVLGLPRGGVPVAAEVARALDAPLDVLPVRKIGLPGQPELAIGAIAPGNVLVRDQHPWLPLLPEGTFTELIARERVELARREQVYRAGRGPLAVAGRTILVVDDGLATGSTMLAAVRACRALEAARVIVAIPVAAPQAVSLLDREADEVIALETPASLLAIGQWYDDFAQLDDQTVCDLLAQAHRQPAHGTPGREPAHR